MPVLGLPCCQHSPYWLDASEAAVHAIAGGAVAGGGTGRQSVAGSDAVDCLAVGQTLKWSWIGLLWFPSGEQSHQKQVA